MPKKGSRNIHEIVQSFVTRLSALIEEGAVVRARESVLSAFGMAGGVHRGPGRPPGSGSSGRPRRKGPIQLCPVPGCQNRAAPVFGMVCSKHKDLPKAKIKAYREARRAKKAGGKKK
jgi:hypothetical protein